MPEFLVNVSQVRHGLVAVTADTAVDAQAAVRECLTPELVAESLVSDDLVVGDACVLEKD